MVFEKVLCISQNWQVESSGRGKLEESTLQLATRAQEIIANTAILPQQAPNARPRVQPRNTSEKRQKENCTQGHSGQKNEGESSSLSL